jgi:hypothetical protein
MYYILALILLVFFHPKRKRSVSRGLHPAETVRPFAPLAVQALANLANPIGVIGGSTSNSMFLK